MTATVLERIAAGDQAAVGECLSLHGGLVWSLAKRYCRDRAEAEDATQEIFLDLWTSAARYRPDLGSESTFIVTIARRRLIDRTRRAAREPDTLPISPEVASILDRPCDAQRLADARDEAERVREAFGSLTDDQRTVLTLSLENGLTYDQIARQTGLPLGTVKTHARRGLIALRDRLAARVEESRS